MGIRAVVLELECPSRTMESPDIGVRYPNRDAVAKCVQRVQCWRTFLIPGHYACRRKARF